MSLRRHGSHDHCHEQGHSHDSNKKKLINCSKTFRLSTMLAMTLSFFFVELIVGEITNSITLIADSFHMLSDVIALIIGLISVRVGRFYM